MPRLLRHALVVLTFVGLVAACGDDAGDESPALETTIESVGRIAASPDGSMIYFTQPGGVWALDTAEGTVSHVAGGGDELVADPAGVDPFTIDLGEATALAVDPDGVPYLTNGRYVYRLEGGMLFPVAGNGTNDLSGDAGPAIEAGLGDVLDIAAAPGGEVWLSAVDGFQGPYRLRRIASDGTISTELEVEAGRVSDVLVTADGAVVYLIQPERIESYAGGRRTTLMGDGATDLASLGSEDLPVPAAGVTPVVLPQLALAASDDGVLVRTGSGLMAIGSDGMLRRIVGNATTGNAGAVAATVPAAELLEDAMSGNTEEIAASADGRIWVPILGLYGEDGSAVIYEIEPGGDTATLVAGELATGS